MVTVACVYWKGPWMGSTSPYDASWVNKLHRMVERNMHVPYEFVCLTNAPKGIHCHTLPLQYNWSGWWSKMELFRPGLFKDRVLFLDLDVLILQDLQPFIDFPSPFATIGRGLKNGKRVRHRDGHMEIFRYNTSVIVFDAGEGSVLYTLFEHDAEAVMNKYRSDQDYIGGKLTNLGIFPKEWIDKLGNCFDGIPTPEMKITLSMPDKNVEAAKKYKWVNELWNQ